MASFAKFSIFLALIAATSFLSCKKSDAVPPRVPEIKVGRDFGLSVSWAESDGEAKTKVILQKTKKKIVDWDTTFIIDAPSFTIPDVFKSKVEVRLIPVGKDGKEGPATSFLIAGPAYLDTTIIVASDVIAGRTTVGDPAENPCQGQTYVAATLLAETTIGDIKTSEYDASNSVDRVFKVTVTRGSTNVVFLVSPTSDQETSSPNRFKSSYAEFISGSNNYTCLTAGGFNMENDTTLKYDANGLLFRTYVKCDHLNNSCSSRVIRIKRHKDIGVAVEKCTTCN